EPNEQRADDWTVLPLPAPSQLSLMVQGRDDEDTTGSERRHQPELARVASVEELALPQNEFEIDLADECEDDVARNSRMTRVMQGVARQVSLDPRDGMEL
ncbi:MAG: conjugal transfer protein TraG, partial [Pigmentiphaga sp.]